MFEKAQAEGAGLRWRTHSPACKVREGFLEEGITTQGKKVDLTCFSQVFLGSGIRVESPGA